MIRVESGIVSEEKSINSLKPFIKSFGKPSLKKVFGKVKFIIKKNHENLGELKDMFFRYINNKKYYKNKEVVKTS